MFSHRCSRFAPFVLSLILVGSAWAADPNDFMDVSEDDLPGQLYVPPEATNSQRPLILFLHGAGETGTNNTAQINANVNNLFDAAKERGAFLYAPQATTTVGGIYNWDDTDRTAAVMSKIDEFIEQQNVDAERLYVTGLSMGGGGTFNFASRYSNRFAAAAPIASVRPAGDFEPSQLTDLPTWAFHARNDGVITKNRSRNAVNDILTAAGEATLEFPPNNDRETLFEFTGDAIDLRYTEYATGGHGIWGRVYDTPELYDWMFAKSVPEPAGGPLLSVAGLWLLRSRRRRMRRG